jgi:hypothetical protein
MQTRIHPRPLRRPQINGAEHTNCIGNFRSRTALAPSARSHPLIRRHAAELDARRTSVPLPGDSRGCSADRRTPSSRHSRQAPRHEDNRQRTPRAVALPGANRRHTASALIAGNRNESSREPAAQADDRDQPSRTARGRVRGRRGLQLTKIACSRLVPAARLSRSGISAKPLPLGLRIQKRARGDSVPTITSPAYLAREPAGAM